MSNVHDKRLQNGEWNFSGMGPEFDEHVAAHLPGYADVQKLIGLAATYLVPDGGTVADYGASTGRTAVEIQRVLPNRDISFHLYDSDQTMLDEAVKRLPNATAHLAQFPDDDPSHRDADLSVALWFLQFIHPKFYGVVLRSILNSTTPGGALIIATKSAHTDSRWQEIAVGALDDYKESQGVSVEERTLKTKALRGTMFPVSVDTLSEELIRSGWSHPTVLWRWHVWTVLGVFKEV